MNSVPACWKPGKDLAFVGQGHQEGLEHLARSALSGQQVIGVAALGAAAHDFEALPVGNVLRIALFVAHFLQELRRAYP